ncbi:hypothetical protein N7533_004377 [Penicillium manginii]|uniref:uncharacterized protein n=1 Tax=Penicillium manginii TaxID=203109 RepID=UPI002547FE41|nr:uncharacterized protein N7533_004377 [Penicillium manginii]KAJ5754834.1 hypothetical protein N7533_004377 [Penicillium manginii]
MGTRGLEIVRFRGRYYIRWHQFDSYLEGLGAKIVASIPSDPVKYQKWLESMRSMYADRESALENNVYKILENVEPDASLFQEFEVIPSGFPVIRSEDWVEYIYIINLDQEIFTINNTIHWKLDNIPRQGELWRHSIVESIYQNELTISLDMCPEVHMASPALTIPERNTETHYDFHLVTPKTALAEPGKAFLTHIAACTLDQYKRMILRFGMEWSPGSFVFRELVFALISMASGQVKCYSFPPQRCNPQHCHSGSWNCTSKLHKWNGWLAEELAGDNGPLLEFGSSFHRPGEPPGVSPTETTYWFQDVLVSLALVIDDESIMRAVTWGIEQKRARFQIVVVSLFQVAFAEVSCSGHEAKPFVKASRAINFSPLRAEYGLSTHPRNRPELKPEMKKWERRGKFTLRSNCTGSKQRLQGYFPGLTALANFFDAAASRLVVSKSAGIFPTELYERILDFVDYDTWRNCLLVSTITRDLCLRKYRVDDQLSVVAGPFVSRRGEESRYQEESLVSFNFENMQTGEVLPMTLDQQKRDHRDTEDTKECWCMPIIGSDRKALMVDVSIHFKPATDVPVEDDSDVALNVPDEDSNDEPVDANSEVDENNSDEEDA